MSAPLCQPGKFSDREQGTKKGIPRDALGAGWGGRGSEVVADLEEELGVGLVVAGGGHVVVVDDALAGEGEAQEHRDVHAGFAVGEVAVGVVEVLQEVGGLEEGDAVGEFGRPVAALGEAVGGVVVAVEAGVFLLDLRDAGFDGELEGFEIDEVGAEAEAFDEAVLEVGDVVVVGGDAAVDEEPVEALLDVDGALDLADGLFVAGGAVGVFDFFLFV